MDILQEVYFGKTPIIPLQKQLTKLRTKLKNKPVTSTTNIDPEIVKFNRLTESIFGFYTFSLYIQPDPIPNAYAFPVDTYFSDEEKKNIYNSISASPTGFKYDKALMKVSMIIAVHSGLLNADNITDEEIMAAILHEIGHGFFEAVTNKDCNYTISRKLISSFTLINKYALDKVKAGKIVTEKIIDKELSTISGFISDIRAKFNKFKSRIFKESMDDNMTANRIRYTNEKFADTFAAMYGYGEECHSVDIKIFQSVYKDIYGMKKYPHFIEIFKTYKMYVNDLLAYTFNIQDEHPAELARIKTTSEYLKKELSKESLDPKLKKELLIELEKVNNLIKMYIEYPKDEDSMRILRLYHIKLYEKFNGDRREQDTDNTALFDAIDDRYNGLREMDDIVYENDSSDDQEEFVVEASNYSETDVFLDILCANADCYNESMINDIKNDIINVSDLWKQWSKYTKNFVKHKWIYRYIDEKQKEQLEKHYKVLCDEKTNYSEYKRSFAFICKFVGLPKDIIILENVVFKKDTKDRDQDIIAVKYSKGLVKVTIPDGIRLIHTAISTDGTKFTEMKPAFRSKTAGKYMYPSKRCFFTCIKAISSNHAGLEGAKTYKVTPKEHIKTVYIDPTYPDFGNNSVFVETDSPIPVEEYFSKIQKIFRKDNREEDKKW